uniref:Apoptosis 1 inhibitor n=2 Tax=Drosophila melanogaster TaxID=7227 RepID=UPI000035DFA4|nr:Chain A, Apoptosis 1 inhibitor [Drosophila melanogaster]1SE0_A Chain A, Apoptosis 1 inhibitor [Drosophila melanogaster]
KNNINKTRMNDLNREETRLKTFTDWPLDWLDKRQLAQTGMYFTHAGDKVKCFFCGVEIGSWEQEDQPVPEHQRWSPNCPLLRRRTTNNVPINAEALDRILPPISYDICGANDSTLE